LVFALHSRPFHGVLYCTALFLGEGDRFTQPQQTSLEVQVLPEGKRLSYREEAAPGKKVGAVANTLTAAHDY